MLTLHRRRRDARLGRMRLALISLQTANRRIINYENLSRHRLRRFHRLQLRACICWRSTRISRLVNLDKLTYAGNLENLQEHRGRRTPRIRAGRHLRPGGPGHRRCSDKYDFDYVINFAAESHVDRSIKNPEIFVETQRAGHREPAAVLPRTPGMTPPPRPGKRAKSICRSPPTRSTAALGADGLFHGDHPAVPPQPVLCLQGQRRHVRQGIPRYLRHADEHHPLLQQLRSLPVPREADPAAHQQRQAAQAAARLRRRHADPRLAVC